MGWNKQSGDAWVLQRTAAIDTNANQPVKMLQLRVLSLLTTEDAEKLARALVEECWAARAGEARPGETREAWKQRTFGYHYGNAVLQHWDETLGVEERFQAGVEEVHQQFLAEKRREQDG